MQHRALRLLRVVRTHPTHTTLCWPLLLRGFPGFRLLRNRHVVDQVGVRTACSLGAGLGLGFLRSRQWPGCLGRVGLFPGCSPLAGGFLGSRLVACCFFGSHLLGGALPHAALLCRALARGFLCRALAGSRALLCGCTCSAVRRGGACIGFRRIFLADDFVLAAFWVAAPVCLLSPACRRACSRSAHRCPASPPHSSQAM